MNYIIKVLLKIFKKYILIQFYIFKIKVYSSYLYKHIYITFYKQKFINNILPL